MLDKIILSIQERFDSSAWKVMNSMERLLIHSICGEKLNDVDINIVLNYSEGDLDHELLSEFQQLRHIVTTDIERQSVSSFALALDILEGRSVHGYGCCLKP